MSGYAHAPVIVTDELTSASPKDLDALRIELSKLLAKGMKRGDVVNAVEAMGWSTQMAEFAYDAVKIHGADVQMIPREAETLPAGYDNLAPLPPAELRRRGKAQILAGWMLFFAPLVYYELFGPDIGASSWVLGGAFAIGSFFSYYLWWQGYSNWSQGKGYKKTGYWYADNPVIGFVWIALALDKSGYDWTKEDPDPIPK